MKPIRSRIQLEQSRCKPIAEGTPALAADEIAQQLKVLPDWAFSENTVERSFGFQNYYQTIAFVNALAWMIHREDHHPALQVGYDHCVVRFDTHTVKGISENDFICAAKCDAIFSLAAADGA